MLASPAVGQAFQLPSNGTSFFTVPGTASAFIFPASRLMGIGHGTNSNLSVVPNY